MENALHVVTGTTAVGKTEFALDYAERMNAEIVCCDASTVYRGMDIGTAKPTSEERARVPHHLLDLVSVSQPFDIVRYVEAARCAVDEISARGKTVLVVGGSGFYLKSFFAPVLDTVEVPEETRARVEEIFAKEGLSGLLEALRNASPDGLGRLDTLNPRRVQRALERCLASGRSLPDLQNEFDERPVPFAGFSKRLILIERGVESLNGRIEARVDAMLAAGLVDEVRALRDEGIESNESAASAIGYREALAYLRGECGEDELRERIVINTRQLAKKQRTWFRTQLPEPDERILY